MKKELAICMSSTPNWIYAAYNTLEGIKKHFKTDYDVILFYDGTQSKDLDILKRDFNVKPVIFDFDLKDEGHFQRVSKMSFARFKCFSLLKEYKTVIWMDSDILIIRDITPLKDYGKENGIAMFRYDNIPMRVSFRKDVPGFDMDTLCFAAGTLMIRDNLKDPEEIEKWVFEAISKYNEYVNSDQAIINLMLQQFKLKVDPIPSDYCLLPQNENENSRILHPWGEEKFWNKIFNDLWDTQYLRWIKAGGTPYDVYEKFRSENVSKLRNLYKKIMLNFK